MATPRKREPAVIVPCSIRNPDPDQPEQAEVFQDATLRGVWLGLKVIAWQARAGSHEGRVLLSAGDRLWVAGVSLASRVGRRVSTRVSEADARVARVCHLMGISVSERGQNWVLQWHQIDTDHTEKTNKINESTARKSPTSAPSEVRSQKRKERREKSSSAAQETFALSSKPVRAASVKEPKPAARAIAIFAEEYKAAIGVNPVVPERDFRELGVTFEQLGEDRMRAALRKFFEFGETDQWIKQQGYSAREFVRQLTKCDLHAQKTGGRPRLVEVPDQPEDPASVFGAGCVSVLAS